MIFIHAIRGHPLRSFSLTNENWKIANKKFQSREHGLVHDHFGESHSYTLSALLDLAEHQADTAEKSGAAYSVSAISFLQEYQSLLLKNNRSKTLAFSYRDRKATKLLADLLVNHGACVHYYPCQSVYIRGSLDLPPPLRKNRRLSTSRSNHSGVLTALESAVTASVSSRIV